MQEDISEDHHEEGKVHSWEVGAAKIRSGEGLSQGRWEKFAVEQHCLPVHRGMCCRM